MKRKITQRQNSRARCTAPLTLMLLSGYLWGAIQRYMEIKQNTSKNDVPVAQEDDASS